MTELAICNLSFQKNNAPILKNINLEIIKNKVYTLIGPSGSGKSTLLQMFNRMLEPTSGEIFYKNKNIIDIAVTELRREIGMVFQQPYLFDGTVEYNLSYGAKLTGQRVNQSDLKNYSLMVGLNEDYLRSNINNLSGGQQQRVAIARVLVNNPKVLLLDEPTSALDPSATEIVEESILKLKNQLNLTIIWVTHNMLQAKRVGDFCIFLDKGLLIEEGETKNFFTSPKSSLTQRFLAGDLTEDSKR